MNPAVTKLRKHLKAKRIDAFLVMCEGNRQYLSGFKAKDHSILESSGALFITQTENFLLTDGRYIEQAQNEARGWNVVNYKKGLVNELKELVKEMGIRRVAIESSCTTLRLYNRLSSELGVELIIIDGIIEAYRETKTEEEIETIKCAIKIAEEVFEESLNYLKVGITEREFAGIIEGLLKKRCEGPSFPVIVASGRNSSLPHAVPTDKRIEKFEPIIIDMGARFNGYCSDMTRTIFLGGVDDFFSEVYEIVRDAQVLAIKNINSMISGYQIDKISRDFIASKGFGKNFLHSLGHGVGIEVHESPSLSRRNKKRLKANSVVTVEPGIYIPGRGGVRLEKMVLVGKNEAIELSSNRWIDDGYVL